MNERTSYIVEKFVASEYAEAPIAAISFRASAEAAYDSAGYSRKALKFMLEEWWFARQQFDKAAEAFEMASTRLKEFEAAKDMAEQGAKLDVMTDLVKETLM